MKPERKRRMENAGWRIGTAKDFLNLSPEEARLVEIRLALMEAVRTSRLKKRISQVELAHRMQTSQSRVAKIEAGDPSVSLDLVVRALIATGAASSDILAGFAAGVRASQPRGRYAIAGSSRKPLAR